MAQDLEELGEKQDRAQETLVNSRDSTRKALAKARAEATKERSRFTGVYKGRAPDNILRYLYAKGALVATSDTSGIESVPPLGVLCQLTSGDSNSSRTWRSFAATSSDCAAATCAASTPTMRKRVFIMISAVRAGQRSSAGATQSSAGVMCRADQGVVGGREMQHISRGLCGRARAVAGSR